MFSVLIKFVTTMGMLYIICKGKDPYFNLATEEYLLKNFSQDILMLWQGENSIIVGKHQNALSEINHRFVHQKDIKVARRLSGGGTVFHDYGNLNFTFIRNVEKIEETNFKLFTHPILEVLNQLPLKYPVTVNNRSDLLIDGKKISGNAEHIYKTRVLHHGTLLFNSELGHLKEALKVDLSRFKDKSVQSNRSTVANISDYLNCPMDLEEFIDFMEDGLSKIFDGIEIYQLSAKDYESIEKLKNEKYQTWQWIYGYSPKYEYSNQINSNGNQLSFQLSVEKGRIKQSNWEGTSSELCSYLKQNITNCPHYYPDLKALIEKSNAQLLSNGISPTHLLDALL